MQKSIMKECVCFVTVGNGEGLCISQHVFDTLFPGRSKTDVIDSDDYQVVVVSYPLCSADQVIESSIRGIYTPTQKEIIDEIMVPKEMLQQLRLNFPNDVCSVFSLVTQ